MIDIQPLITMLKTSLTVPVYQDVIPEDVPLPAVAVSNIANLSSRVLAGKKVKPIYTYRVTASANSTAELQALLTELENLDNSSNNDFQRVLSQLVLREAKMPNEPVRRAFYDLTLYPR